MTNDQITLSIPQGEGKFPIVLLLQGFLGKRNGEKISSLSNHLSELGIASIRFDYPEDNYLVSNILKGIESVLEFVKTQPNIDNSRIGLWGQSMGGMLALITASKHLEIKAVCSVSSPAQITVGDDLEKLVPQWKEAGFLERKNSKDEPIKIPYKFVEDARQWDVTESVKRIHTPVLIILGTKDETVFPQSTREIYKSANDPKQLIEVENMPHDYKEDKNFLLEVNKLSGDFFHTLICS